MKMRVIFSILILVSLSSSSFTATEAHGPPPPPPGGNISIKWDLINWTPDGYVAVVTMNNFQKQRGIASPGWKLGWTWAGKEVIWSIIGSQATEQGDCSRFRGNIPHSCRKTPSIVDLLLGAPYNQQIAYCCKGGVLSPWSNSNSNSNSTSAFQITVGRAGNTARTAKRPHHFTFKAPAAAYSCGPPKIIRPTLFLSADKRRTTRALKTWRLVCFYSSKAAAQ